MLAVSLGLLSVVLALSLLAIVRQLERIANALERRSQPV
jgi:hypothetical protein